MKDSFDYIFVAPHYNIARSTLPFQIIPILGSVSILKECPILVEVKVKLVYQSFAVFKLVSKLGEEVTIVELIF